MEPPAPRPIPTLLRHLLLPLLLCGGVVWLCYYPLQYLVVLGSAPWVAQNLAPPPYPNAILLEDRQFTQGNRTFAIQRHYYTPDSPEEVFLYMNGYMELREWTEAEGESNGYYGFREERGWVGEQIAEISCISFECRLEQSYPYPSFTLYFYPTPDDGGGTQILYEFTYPTP